MASFLSKLRFLSVVGCWLLVVSSFGCGDLDTDLSSLIISPSVVTIGVSQTRLFSVVAKDSLGFIVSASPAWSSDSNIGSIGSTGLFTAVSSSAEGSVYASYGGKTASATVTVTEYGWLEGRINSPFGYMASIKVYLEEAPTLLDFSDSDGRYSISNIPAGTYEARTLATSTFKVASEEVVVGKGQTITWTILLETQPGVPVVPTTTLPDF
ncbi:MAG: hypothetical protein ABIA67_00235 [Candidatus Margulisiibacteriota bacterium]